MSDISTRIRPLVLAGAAALLAGAGAGPAHADDTTTHRGPAHEQTERHYDYSRFSDGPRRVPTPRGSSLRRARELGLGRRRTATRLLGGRPLPSWVHAARGDGVESLYWPVDGGRFGRGFGFTRRRRRDLRHDGIDIVAPEGNVVRAVGDGIVAYSDNGVHGYGNCVLVVHGDGKVSLYAHMLRTTVQAGWRVSKGERIGFVGATGIARGPHLHFELRDNGHLVDPAPLFDRSTVHRGSGSHADRAGADDAPEGSHSPAASQDAATEQPGYPVASILSGHASDGLLEQAGRHFSNLLWPVHGGELARPFSRRHRAIDIAAPRGTAIRAAADGLVVEAGPGLDGLGRSIVLLHRNGWVTVYGSSSKVEVSVGQLVRRGEWIGEVGSSGASDGSHLHFELRDGGELRDPGRLLVQVPDN